MEQSILKSTKKVLGIADDDDSFDLDILTHINSAFSILTDLGVGYAEGFTVEDDSATWDDVLPDEDWLPEHVTRLNKVKLSKIKTCVYLRTKLLFDPPIAPPLLTAMKDQLQEIEWRLSVNRETTEWVDPNPPVVVPSDEDDVDIGFGL